LEHRIRIAGRVVPVGRTRGITEDTAKRQPLGRNLPYPHLELRGQFGAGRRRNRRRARTHAGV